MTQLYWRWKDKFEWQIKDGEGVFHGTVSHLLGRTKANKFHDSMLLHKM
jgi:hypothetical protein